MWAGFGERSVGTTCCSCDHICSWTKAEYTFSSKSVVPINDAEHRPAPWPSIPRPADQLLGPARFSTLAPPESLWPAFQLPQTHFGVRCLECGDTALGFMLVVNLVIWVILSQLT